jgi:hypothetical protein
VIPTAPQGPHRPLGTRNRSVAAVWIGGIALIALVDLIGPDRFIAALPRFGQWVVAALQNLGVMVMSQAYDLVRASAIGLFAVFWLLTVIAARRGQRVARRLIVVTVTWLLFMAPALNGEYVSSDRWLGALLLGAVAAFVATRRLAEPGTIAAS